MKLKNGASVISKSKCKDIGFVILAQKRRANDSMEYITWLTDNELNCYHGNYHNYLKNATHDYKDRVIKYC